MAKSSKTPGVFLVAALIAIAYWGRFAFPQWAQSEKSTPHVLSQQSLSQDERASLERLGLTPKDPVIITNSVTGQKTRVTGRFLHITDFHPDPYYKEGSDIDNMCHGGKGEAGRYGDAVLGCDSPMTLVKSTIDWIDENLKDKVDFIVWTGDNVRHDNDRRYPRSETDIFNLNQEIADAMSEKFGDMPIPSLGNNDVYPHNLIAPGPTLQTREFFKIWRPFIPQAQMHIFERGVYFFDEVIPNQLAVLSINTLYWFQSNPLVDSCDRAKDPGHKLFLWLGYVLKEMRKRNMKVWLTGHVPPTPKNYDVSCLRKYVAWTHEYRDVIVGGLYGHMNIDHFFPHDAVEAYKSIQNKYESMGFKYDNPFEDESLDLESSGNSSFLEETSAFSFQDKIDIQGGVPQKKVKYMEDIRDDVYASIKNEKKSGEHGERYSVVHIASSIVPTFNPGMRVWEYNITDLYSQDSHDVLSWDLFFKGIDHYLEENSKVDLSDQFEAFKGSPHVLKRDKSFPKPMPANKPLGPAYVPQLFTPERYVQYYLDLKAINKGKKDFGYELEYTTDDKTYDMKDLTVSSWLGLARKLAESKKKDKAGKSLWEKFLSHNFISSDYENLGYG